MNITRFRKSIARFLIYLMVYGQIAQVQALTLSTSPLAASTTSVVRPNLMYVLDDSGSMSWDYTPDYINDDTVTDPTNAGATPAGSSGDSGTATHAGGVITGISATGGNYYTHATPSVLIQGSGTGAAATVTLAANKTIQSVTMTAGGTGYATTASTYVTFLGGLKTSAWGMCWGTTGTSNQGGSPKDTSSAPKCTTSSQMPYSTAAVNYQYYDPLVRYLPPLYADGTSYASASTTAAKSDGFAGTGSTNLTTGWTHEVWCNTASPSPTPSSSNIATHTQCKENSYTGNPYPDATYANRTTFVDASGSTHEAWCTSTSPAPTPTYSNIATHATCKESTSVLYPNVTYNFRKTYTGPASYFVMEPSEYCTNSDLTSCITSTAALAASPAFQVSGVTFNVPSNYRWCSYYNPHSKSFGGCQAKRDLDHYIPNYLGGWVSAGTPGTQATATLTIGATLTGQQITGLTIGGDTVVGSTTFTSAANGDEATVATSICTSIQNNTATTGFSCSRTGATITLQAAAMGTEANGKQVIVTGPASGATANTVWSMQVSPFTASHVLSLTDISVGTTASLISANVTDDGTQGGTAALICGAINAGPSTSTYIARSGSQAAVLGNTVVWGECLSDTDAYIQIKRIPVDTTDNGKSIVVQGPASATLNTGSIQINATSGATSISNVTKGGVTLFDGTSLTIADGTATTSIATALAAKINLNTGTHGCTATSSSSLVTLSCTSTGTLAVTSGSTAATGTLKVTSTTHSYGADLGGITVGGTSLAGNLTSSTFSDGTAVSANATSIKNAINAGVHGFTAATPTANGDGTYNMVVTAPAGTTYNGQSFTFQNGTAVVAGSGTSPVWNFNITGASTDSDVIDFLRCENSSGSLYMASTDSSTGTTSGCGTNNILCTGALATALNSAGVNGFSYTCAYESGTQNNQVCNVTGPSGASACTSNLSITKDSTITINPSPSIVTAGSAVCPAITAPTWTFEIDDADSTSKYMNSIKCGTTDTITPSAAHTGTSSSETTRRQYLAGRLAANAINGYAYSCSSADKPICTVTGPAAAAACTSLTFSYDSNIDIDDASSASQSCPAVSTGASATWTFKIDNATTRSKLINSVTCNGANTISTDTVSTGAASTNPDMDRINNLVTALAGNDTNGYTVSCTSATAGTLSSACTVTGPVGVSACTSAASTCAAGQMRIGYDSSITITGGTAVADSGDPPKRMCVTPSSTGSSAGSSVDDYAPFLFTVSSFSGGAPSQGTTVTDVTSATVGPIGVTTSQIVSGTNETNFITTNARSTDNNVMAGGTASSTATNYWTGVGIFKRVDVVSTTTSYTRASGRTDCASSTCTYTEELQNFANWYSYYRTRMLTMKSATTLAFSQLDSNYRVGYDNICQATGTSVKLPVAQFNAAAKTSWWAQLTAASPACATPLRAETAKIGRYFAGKLTAQADPMEYSCQRNYMLLVTDGYWNETDSSSIKGVSDEDIGNRDNTLSTSGRPYYDGQESSTTCPTVGATRSAASSCRNLSDIAFYYYSTDLRTSALGNSTNSATGVDVATNNVLTSTEDKNQAQHMNMFTMGLGIDGKLAYKSDYDTASTGDFVSIKTGSKNWPAVENLDPTAVDDLWHAAVNGRGKYFNARNVPNVVAGLRDALNQIGARVGSAAAAATSNLEPVAGDNYAYVASYTTVDWTGDLQSRTIDTTTGEVSSETACTIAGTNCQWSAQNMVDNMVWSARRIKLKPSSGTSGDPLRDFAYDNLSAAEKAYFNPSTLSQYAALSVSNASDITAANLVDFLRGNKGLEQDGDVSHAQIWRKRAHVLGDIVNTQPVYMKAPSASYEDSGYSTYKTSGTASARKPVVFVSGNDGMLHAFNAYTSSVTVSGTTVASGEEMWAYIPSQAMPTMKNLADPNYTHRYFVDGLITVADVDFGSGDWHTILVGGLGGGGTQYYALDVTDPTNPKFLWEYSHSNLGYTFSNIAVSKLPNGEWAVFFTSGYNNTGGTGMGYLYALNPQTGVIKTGYPLTTTSGSSGSPSNLGKLAIWADNPGTDNTAQYVYAGDLNGDLWRFDLDHTGSGHSGTQVFKLAHFENSLPQPITTKPELTATTDGVRLVSVGTGKYLETADLTSTDVQAVYVVKDTLGVANLGGASQDTWNPLTDTTTVSATTVPMFLTRRLISTKEDGSAITTTIDGATRDARMVCPGASSTVTAAGACANTDTTTLDWAVYGGWYASFPESGERMNVDPKLIRGSLVFVTNIPSANSCTTGGDAYFNVLDVSTGLAVAGETTVTTKLKGSLAVGLTVIKLSSGEYKAIVTKSDYQQETLAVPVAPTSGATSSTFGSKKGLWREFEAY
jgi:type IV pilus assembly protein PilY1